MTDKLQAAMQEVSGLNADGVKVQGGKRYTQVVVRVEVFRKHLGFNYGIETEISEFAGGFMAKAIVRDLSNDKVIGTGHSYATSIAKEKSVEKFETTAIGRALASCGLSGGEYATQDEMETHAERYEPKPVERDPRPDKIFQRDFLYRLALCKTDEECTSLVDEMGDQFDGMPDYITDTINDALSARAKQIADGVKTPEPKFGFVDVNEAVQFATQVKSLIDDSKLDVDDLQAYMNENAYKINAIDAMLKAEKYKKDGKTTQERLKEAYDERVKP